MGDSKIRLKFLVESFESILLDVQLLLISKFVVMLDMMLIVSSFKLSTYCILDNIEMQLDIKNLFNKFFYVANIIIYWNQSTHGSRHTVSHVNSIYSL